MNSSFARFKLSGLLPYLLTRSRLRFFDKANVKAPGKSVSIFGRIVSLSMVDLEQKYLAADCIREPENLLVYRAIASSGLVNTFIDIGANCGHVAASILNNYAHILLFEPNPKLAELLRQIYIDQKHVEIKECAIVDEASVGTVTLTVPDDSSGLATLGGTHLSSQHGQFQTFRVKASTLAKEVDGYDLSASYIKIDVEGFEANIIQSAKVVINDQRSIVGFEALSGKAAINCAKLFNNHVFYCARFDFLENGGALSKSIMGMLKALMFGASIEILKLDKLESSDLANFSQIYAVPAEKAHEFERSILSYSASVKTLDLSRLKAWS
jgi:FkbM family methyltransferase